ncbi:hypothetical protein GCM10010197_06830 [Nocardioides luteus]|uniref:Uncharacterized protein n=1 Tax=Nocardioides luteus TaxID=1844 RepID=A0ABQ5SPV0_9ACTN|nr:hypothetical protein GCM10010197_06830 [Nocardioides luteus]GLJ66178.1 hypothetical protein GCM10017579_02140 [Nocardioides luteus]
MAVVLLQPLGPLLPGEVLALAGDVGGAGLGVVAVELEVAQLGVGHEHAVVEERGADAGAEGGHDDQPAAALRGAVADLGQPGRVGVVDHVHVTPGGGGEDRVRVGADPRLVDVGRGVDHPVAYDSGDGDPDLPVVVGELAEQLHEDLGDGIRGGSLRRRDAYALGGELAGGEVDRGPLDARAAEVDAEGQGRRHVPILFPTGDATCGT